MLSAGFQYYASGFGIGDPRSLDHFVGTHLAEIYRGRERQLLVPRCRRADFGILADHDIDVVLAPFGII